MLLQQAQAAYQRAAAAAPPDDPLRADSTLLVRRIAVVRVGDVDGAAGGAVRRVGAGRERPHNPAVIPAQAGIQ